MAPNSHPCYYMFPGMSIKSRYPVRGTTGITGPSTGAGTQTLIVPVPNTEKMSNFDFSVPVLPRYQNR
jgi:hypothetical protein